MAEENQQEAERNPLDVPLTNMTLEVQASIDETPEEFKISATLEEPLYIVGNAISYFLDIPSNYLEFSFNNRRLDLSYSAKYYEIPNEGLITVKYVSPQDVRRKLLLIQKEMVLLNSRFQTLSEELYNPNPNSVNTSLTQFYNFSEESQNKFKSYVEDLTYCNKDSDINDIN